MSTQLQIDFSAPAAQPQKLRMLDRLQPDCGCGREHQTDALGRRRRPCSCRSQLVAILRALDTFQQRNARCWPSVATLAKRIGRTERTVQRMLRLAERLGFLHREFDAGQTTAKYAIQWLKIWYAVEEPQAAPEPVPSGDTVSPHPLASGDTVSPPPLASGDSVSPVVVTPCHPNSTIEFQVSNHEFKHAHAHAKRGQDPVREGNAVERALSSVEKQEEPLREGYEPLPADEHDRRLAQYRQRLQLMMRSREPEPVTS